MDNIERAIAQLYAWSDEPGNDMHDELEMLVHAYREQSVLTRSVSAQRDAALQHLQHHINRAENAEAKLIRIAQTLYDPIIPWPDKLNKIENILEGN